MLHVKLAIWRRRLSLLVALFLFALGVGYGVMMHRNHWPPYPLLYRLAHAPVDRPHGRWRPVLHAIDDAQVRAQTEQLQALGYLSGSRPPDDTSGVQVLLPEQVGGGVNLYTSGESSSAVLMDASGQVLHRWSYLIGDLLKTPVPAHKGYGTFWRRVALLPERDLLAIYEGLALVRLDSESRPKWVIAHGAHHDLQVLADQIVFLGQRKRALSSLGSERLLFEDTLVYVGLDGVLLRTISLVDALLNSRYASLLQPLYQGNEVLHANSLQVMRGPDPIFGSDNVLLSFREIDTVAVLDPRKEQIIWALRGAWRRQHEARLLENGHLLVFDNQQRPGGVASRVVELDPRTQAVVWEYTADDFFSRSCGTAQRLSNGNTLITESDAGRAFEVNPAGEVVWRFNNPARAGDGDQWVATLFHLNRLGSTD